MKRLIVTLSVLAFFTTITIGQVTDKTVSNCLMNAGTSARFLKDFRIQLGKGNVRDDFRYKAKISLWKNTRYRFVMCNADGSGGELILNIRDDTKRLIVSSVDPKTKKIYPYVDFVCSKSGIYELYYDFKDKQAGSGVGLVSMLK